MKRIAIRVSAVLGAVVLLGGIAYVYAQRISKTPEAAAAKTTEQPKTGTAGDAKKSGAPSSDPFALQQSAAPSRSGGNDLFDRFNDPQKSATQASSVSFAGGASRTSAPPAAYSGQDASTAETQTQAIASDAAPPADYSNSPLPGDRYRGASQPAGVDRYGNIAEVQTPPRDEGAYNPLRGGSRYADVQPAADQGASGAGSDPFQTADAAGQGAAGSQDNQGAAVAADPPAEERVPPSSLASGNRYSRIPVESEQPAASEPARLTSDAGNPLRRLPPNSMPQEQPLGPPASSAVGPLANRTAARVSDPSGLTDGSGRPGNKQLEGAQSPSLTIQKFAPEEIQIGKPATFEILVRNVGEAPAQNVTIHDQVPKGTRLTTTNPPAERGAAGELVWALGTLAPGDEQVVKVELLPLEEGEIGSVATVHFAAQSSVRTVATRPELAIEVTSERTVMIGEQIPLLIKVSNPGTGPATGVTIKAALPATLTHSAGGELEYEVGELKPGETQELELVLSAAKAGLGTNILMARGDGNLKVEKPVEIEVVAPGLEVAMEGPRRRFLERPATYTVTVTNPGTAAAREVELVTHLPKGLEFVKADNYGEYDPQTRTVRWSLESLPAKETGSVTLVAMPMEAGEQKLVVEGTAEQGLSDKQVHDVLIEGVAAIVFQVVDVEDPIEAGGETMYEIHVVNQGSKAATEIQLEALLPEGMKALSADGPAPYAASGGQVLFEPLARLAPKADVTYRVRVQCLQAGDMRIRVRLMTKEMISPVTKEESTRVFPAE